MKKTPYEIRRSKIESCVEDLKKLYRYPYSQNTHVNIGVRDEPLAMKILMCHSPSILSKALLQFTEELRLNPYVRVERKKLMAESRQELEKQG